MFCRHSGIKHREGFLICPKCGRRQHRWNHAHRCAHCGKHVHIGLTVCPGCGRDLRRVGLVWRPWATTVVLVALVGLAWRGPLPVQVIEHQLLDSRDAIEQLVKLYDVISGVASLDTGAVPGPVAIASVSGETVQETSTGRVQPLPEPKPSPEAIEQLSLPSPTSAPPTSAPAAEPVVSVQAVVKAASINVRSGPAVSYSVVNTGRAGMTYDVIARDGPGDWLRVAGTRESWITADLLDVQGGAGVIARLPITVPQVVRVAATPSSSAVVKSARINVRAGPGTTFEVVDVAASGSTFGVTTRDRTGAWYRLAGESERWVAAAVIEVKDPPPAATPPPVPPSPVSPATTRVMPTTTMETVSTTAVPPAPRTMTVMAPSPTATRVPTYTPISAPTSVPSTVPPPIAAAVPQLSSLPTAAPATATTAAPATPTTSPPATPTTAAPATPTTAARPLITPTPYVVVKANRLNIRSGPATAFDSVGVVLAGATRAIVGRTADGAWFRLAGDTERWVSSELVAVMGGMPPVVSAPDLATLSAPAPTPFVVVNAEQINIQSGPDTTYNVVGTASRGASYAVVERSEAGDWYRLAGDKERWVSAALLKLTGNPPPRTSTSLVKTAGDVPSRDSAIAPVLVKPIDGFTLWPFNDATFQWRWTGRPLEANQGFEVRIWVDNSPEHLGVAPPVPFVLNSDHVYTLYVGSVRTAPGIVKVSTGDWANLWWTVAVVQISPYAPIGPEARPFHMPTQLK